MKKYHVSLAVNMPFNWDIEVEAVSQSEAIEKAGDMLVEDSTSGILKEVDGPIELVDGYEMSADVTEIK